MTVPIVGPATVQKNADGTYSVRIQHTQEGTYTEVHFPNVVFAEQMAEAYAAFINGTVDVIEEVKALPSQVKTLAIDGKVDAEKLLAEAKQAGAKIVDVAVMDAKKIETEAAVKLSAADAEAKALLAKAKAEAEKVVADAKAMAKTIAEAAKATEEVVEETIKPSSPPDSQ